MLKSLAALVLLIPALADAQDRADPADPAPAQTSMAWSTLIKAVRDVPPLLTAADDPSISIA